MNLMQLLFDDEGAISRRQWWNGTLALVVAHVLAGWIAAVALGPSGLDRPAMLFVSLALLIPFHAVNAKRSRAIGRPPVLALAAAAIAGASILAGAFARTPELDLSLGLGLTAAILWCVLDLGVLDHAAGVDPARIDAAAKRR